MNLFRRGVFAAFCLATVAAVACSSSSGSSGDGSCAKTCQETAPCGETTCLAYCINVQTSCSAAGQAAAFDAWASCNSLLTCTDGEYESLPTCLSQSVGLIACGIQPGGTGTPDAGVNTACATLSACCSKLPAESLTSCQAAVTAGNATTCASDLSMLMQAGSCGGIGVPDASFHPDGTVVPGNDGGPGDDGSTGNQDAEPEQDSSTGFDSAPPANCTPHALPANFQVVNHPAPSNASCTTTTMSTVASDCFTSPTATCNTDIETTCGECVFTANTAADWGPVIVFEATGASPAVEIEYPFFNDGSYVERYDPSGTGLNCGQALEAQIECELAACVPYCPVTSASDTVGTNALIGTFDPSTGDVTTNGCLQNADSSVCANYVNATNTECASELTDAGTGALTAIQNATTYNAFFGEYCGGGS